MNALPLTEKYRPRNLTELVVPPEHNLQPAFGFIQNPFASAWLLTGKSGSGKSSLARIMAASCAHPLATQIHVGPDLTGHAVKDLASTVLQRPLWGGFYAVVVDEADSIPAVGQIRLLHVLENAPYAAFFFTSNEDNQHFEARFLSRLIELPFTNQGLFEPARDWLQQIAEAEGLDLDRPEAGKIIRSAKNNLRTALNLLQIRLHSSKPIPVPALSPASTLGLGQSHALGR